MPRSLLLLSLLLPTVTAAAPRNPFDAEVAERRSEARRLTGRAEAIVPLLGVLDLWRLVDDRPAIGAFLDEVASSTRQRPEVRARATYLRSIVYDHLGATAEADRLRASLGLITKWQIIGPFDNEGKAGHGRVYPIENELGQIIDERREHAGKERPVRWRSLPDAAVAQGVVSFENVLRPEQSSTAYATTFVHVDAPTDVAVRIGSSGAIKAWVNEELAVDRDVYRAVRIDQDAAATHLHAGWNRITVKLGNDDGAWAFFLRLTAPNGEPLAFFTSTETRSSTAGPHTPAKTKVADLGADLRRAAARRPRDPATARALGLYLHYVAPDDPERRGAERELKRALRLRRTSEHARLAAFVTADLNDRRRLLEEAVTLGANATPIEQARALFKLGESYSQAHRERQAEETWRRALAADSELFPAALALAELTADRGLPAKGLADVEAVEERHPALAAKQAAAELASRLGRQAEAERRTLSLLEENRDEIGLLRELYGMATARGDLPAALGWLDRMAALRPDLVSVALDRADLLEALDRSAEAHRVLERALAVAPDDARLNERDGRVLHRLGRDVQAIERFRRALALRPQNPELAAYLRHVERQLPSPSGQTSPATAASELARAYARPIGPLLGAAREAEFGRGDGARVLLDLKAIRVHANGLSETFTQRVVEIRDARAAREQGDFEIRYTPDTQQIEVRAAKVYKASGQVVQAALQSERDLSEPWYGLYYDVRALVLQFSALDPGDVIDLEYVVADNGRRNLFADYFGDLHLLQEELPRLETIYVLDTPAGRPFYFNQPRLSNLTRGESKSGERLIRTFRAEKVPKIELEPGMPGFTDVAAYLHVSTYKTWEEVASWYSGLVRDQLVPDEAVTRAVEEAVRGVTDERARIRAVYNVVVKRTRYVGLEFGIHGYKPYRVSQVFARKFGDCKDKASLLVAMLRILRVDATLVLARTRRGGDLDPFPASLAPFDHAIVYVPKYDLYLDGTAEFSGSDELPAQDQDIPVLLVSDPRTGGKGHLGRTPVAPPSKNRVAHQLRVALEPSGAARVAVEMAIAGEAAHEWRSLYQTPGERLERFEKAVNLAHPGSRVAQVEFPVIDDLERPVELRADVRVPSWAHPVGNGGLSMPALGHEGELLRSNARLSERRHDLVLGYPWEEDEHVVISLPKGFVPKQLPAPRRIVGPFGTFTLDVEEPIPGEVAIRARFSGARHRIPRAEYAAFRRFCLDIDTAVGQKLVVGHE